MSAADCSDALACDHDETAAPLRPVHRRRVFGATRAGAWASIPLGILLGGLAVETLGVAVTLFAVGVCYLAVTSYGFFNPAFREMDHQAEDGAGSANAEDPEPRSG
ncbi:MAG: hypothetical protein H0U00_12845 [Actinobacteria bacterium]|nr:hypothetical protein [Actinomycetota bacterium]